MTHRDDGTTSRREFLISSTWIALNLPVIQAAAHYARRAVERQQGFEVLTPEEATELEAIAAQIIPTDDTPGAKEAGVIYFIDRAVGTFAADALQDIRDGLDQLRLTVQQKYPDALQFSQLLFDDQTTVLKEIQDSDFFGWVHYLTIASMFANPSYGGNRDKVGWKLLGFDDRFIWQPPFGYYDRDYVDESGR